MDNTLGGCGFENYTPIVKLLFLKLEFFTLMQTTKMTARTQIQILVQIILSTVASNHKKSCKTFDFEDRKDRKDISCSTSTLFYAQTFFLND